MQVRAKDLVKSYGSIQALKGITFTIPKRVITGFIGPNGAGKTTTLKILMGMLKPDYGEVEVLGYNPWSEGHILRRIVGYLPENPIFPKGIKCYRLIEFYAQIKKVHNVKAEITRLAKLTGFTEYLDRRVDSLSRGYIQRLALILALIGEPKLVLLDEPTSHLDPITRTRILNIIKRIYRDEGIDFIISTHILHELERLCNYIIIIDKGHILEQGEARELASKRNMVIKYIAEAPKNIDLFRVKKEIASLDYVTGIEIDENIIKVSIKGTRCQDFEVKLHELNLKLKEVQVPDLIKLYSKVIGGSIEG